MSAHNGQLDKQGVPYAFHPISVMAALGNDATENERIAALLHDVVEDTPYNFLDLHALGYSTDVTDIVSLLTRDKLQTYDEFIARLVSSENKEAMRVKLADLRSNLDPARGPIPESRRQRYLKARLRLMKALSTL